MGNWFRRFANRMASILGTPWAFLTAVLVVVGWALTGPTFNYNDSWQIAINTGTTIVTFLMIFLVQATQNRDAATIQLKLDELILSLKETRDNFALLDDASDDEIAQLRAQLTHMREQQAHKSRKP